MANADTALQEDRNESAPAKMDPLPNWTPRTASYTHLGAAAEISCPPLSIKGNVSPK